jgi:hypothetical protein
MDIWNKTFGAYSLAGNAAMYAMIYNVRYHIKRVLLGVHQNFAECLLPCA